MNIEQIEEMAEAIEDHIKSAITPLIKRIDSLESIKQISIDEVIAKIEIPKNGIDGKDGIDGEKGIDGINGTNGIDGKDGLNGKDADIEQLKSFIIDEIKKQMPVIEKALDGINGKDGVNGNDGKDALQIEILAEIDTTKSYSRGIYAKHNNGLWRSYERTTGLKGWECLVNGVASLEVIQNSEREFSVKSLLSDGTEVIKSLDLPVMIYKEIFKEGTEYKKGDMVTWGGSLWHCQEPTIEKPSENAKSWKLAAKRGANGKDGTNGKDLVKGVSMQ